MQRPPRGAALPAHVSLPAAPQWTSSVPHLPAVPVGEDRAGRPLLHGDRGGLVLGQRRPTRCNLGGHRAPAHSQRRKGAAGCSLGMSRSFPSLSEETKERPGFICHHGAAARLRRRCVMSLRHRPMPSGQNATRSLETGEDRAACESCTEPSTPLRSTHVNCFVAGAKHRAAWGHGGAAGTGSVGRGLWAAGCGSGRSPQQQLRALLASHSARVLSCEETLSGPDELEQRKSRAQGCPEVTGALCPPRCSPVPGDMVHRHGSQWAQPSLPQGVDAQQ